MYVLIRTALNITANDKVEFTLLPTALNRSYMHYQKTNTEWKLVVAYAKKFNLIRYFYWKNQDLEYTENKSQRSYKNNTYKYVSY